MDDNLMGRNDEKVRCQGILHVVKKGDTLYRIAKMYHVPLARVMFANPYVDVYNLQVGDEICVPVMTPRPPMGENQPGMRPPMEGNQPGMRPPMGENQPGMRPPIGENQPGMRPPMGGNRPGMCPCPPSGENRPEMRPPMDSGWMGGPCRDCTDGSRPSLIQPRYNMEENRMEEPLPMDGESEPDAADRTSDTDEGYLRRLRTPMYENGMDGGRRRQP